jgi:hypothetical protein
MLARGYAFIAVFDTTFVVFRWHNLSPFLLCLFLFQRTSGSQNLSTHFAPGGVESYLSSHGRKSCLRVGRRDANQLCVHELRTENAVSFAIGS